MAASAGHSVEHIFKVNGDKHLRQEIALAELLLCAEDIPGAHRLQAVKNQLGSSFHCDAKVKWEEFLGKLWAVVFGSERCGALPRASFNIDGAHFEFRVRVVCLQCKVLLVEHG